MANNYQMLIRENSWWMSANVPKRHFVIVRVHQDFKAGTTDLINTGVSLLEFGYDHPRELGYKEFVQNIDSGALLPLNTIPKPLEKHEQTKTRSDT